MDGRIVRRKGRGIGRPEEKEARERKGGFEKRREKKGERGEEM